MAGIMKVRPQFEVTRTYDLSFIVVMLIARPSDFGFDLGDAEDDIMILAYFYSCMLLPILYCVIWAFYTLSRMRRDNFEFARASCARYAFIGTTVSRMQESCRKGF